MEEFLRLHRVGEEKYLFYSVTLGGGLHLIDIMLMINNSEVEKVIAVGNNISTKRTRFNYYDSVTSLIKFKNGSTAKINSNFEVLLLIIILFKSLAQKGQFCLIFLEHI